MTDRVTKFSDDRVYRYTLWRDNLNCGLPLSLDPSPPETRNENFYVQFIGLNPSTADETKDDPTVRRCIRFVKDWGYGALCMTNLFAYRATDPKDMKKFHAPIGEHYQNDVTLQEIANGAALVICAWGKDGNFKDRQRHVVSLLKPTGKLHHLGLNGDGTPRHPLYLKASTMPTKLCT
jgi:hypothetical protein